MQKSPHTMEIPSVSQSGGLSGHSDAPGGDYDRRVHNRMGGGLQWEICERPLVCSSSQSSHKCLGTAGSDSSTVVLFVGGERSSCSGEDGQHQGHGVYKSPGGRALPVIAPVGKQLTAMGGRAPVVSQSSSCPTGGRLMSQSPGCQSDMAAVLHS